MALKIAINGFGRIGRTTFKAGFGRPELEFVAVNDLADTKTLAHLFKYDTVYGLYEKEVSFDNDHLIVDGQKIKVLAEKEPAKLPWQDLGVDVVLECTGLFTTEEGASQHFKAGAKRVIVSAPIKEGNVPTYVLGVNARQYQGETLINNASCTTNCIAPVARAMEESFGIAKAFMTTVHAYTADQRLQDAPHRDLRRARAAAANIVPTTTGAAIATTETLPVLRGRFNGLAIRVPVPVVSLTDFTFVIKKKTTAKKINQVFQEAARDPSYQGVLAWTEEELVSSDFIKDSHSATLDLKLTQVIEGDLVKVVAWYDNEWGYSCRMIELAELVGKSVGK